MSETSAADGLVLSRVPVGKGEGRLALAVLAVSTLIFVAAAPFAKVQLAPVSAFIPAYEAALVINDLITAVLLLGMFSAQRSWDLLLLAAGYLFTAAIAVCHALTFPGLFSATGLLGAGPQSTAWLYMFWHAGFPLLVIAYALLQGRKRAAPAALLPLVIPGCVAAVLLAVGALTAWATVGHDLLPAIMAGNQYTPAMLTVVGSVWLLSGAALLVLWFRRPHTLLGVWMMVVMCAWMFDVALAAVLNHGRFDLGFYAGRIYGLLAASCILMVLLIQNALLYSRLAQAYARESQERLRAQQQSRELAVVNRELDAFAYSVSHDLRAPLRGIVGFSDILMEDLGPRLEGQALDYLARIQRAGRHMAQLIDGILELSRISRDKLRQEQVDLSALATQSLEELARMAPERQVECTVAPGLWATGDVRLLRVLLDNLLGNAWKFTGRTAQPRIEFGALHNGEGTTYFVQDNGAGFDMAYAHKLFGAFQRLHSVEEFPGTGIGLATVQRIVQRHGGRIWAESQVGQGTTISFTL